MNGKVDIKSDFFTVLRERHAVKRYDDHYRMNDDEIRASHTKRLSSTFRLESAALEIYRHYGLGSKGSLV